MQKNFQLPYNPKLKPRKKELRRQGILSEVIFWNAIKTKQIDGYLFTKQKIIGNYIVDFYCSKLKLVIEIDGSSHDNKLEYDKARDSYLKALGLNIIHFTDKDVLNDLNCCLVSLNQQIIKLI